MAPGNAATGSTRPLPRWPDDAQTIQVLTAQLTDRAYQLACVFGQWSLGRSSLEEVLTANANLGFARRQLANAIAQHVGRFPPVTPQEAAILESEWRSVE